jgi:RNA polymerase sigma-70 factor, ECF subfamily
LTDPDVIIHSSPVADPAARTNDRAALTSDPAAQSATATVHWQIDQLESIYQENFELVWRGLRRLGVPISSVDDASQDVFLVVHRRLADFEGRSTLRSWIFGIAVHVARHYRRLAARAANEDPDMLLVDDARSNPAQQLEDQQARQLVYAALDRLSEAHREAFVLCDIEEMTAREAAKLLGIPENTVYSRLRHARAHFETMLEDLRHVPRREP